MDYKLKNFITLVTVSRIANLHCFEFINEYHTTDASHDFCEILYVDRGVVTVTSDNYKR